MNIGIVNDLPLAVEAMRRAIALRPEHRVLWVATDGAQAVDFCLAQPPDVVLMDLIMPKFDGVEATRRIMAQAPCAILVVTSSVGANAWRVYEAMGAGALDAVDTPTLADNRLADASQPLLAKIDQIGRLLDKPAVTPTPRPNAIVSRGAAPLIAIGASAGGPSALAAVLGKLPADFPGAIVIVQHVDKAFAEGMAQWLDGQTALKVRVALDGDQPTAGEALLAATNDHLQMKHGGTLGYTGEPSATPYRPSVDVFFHSVVEHWRASAIGVLLTGMGRDGAIGLKAMRAKGYLTIAQDQASCAVYGMPKAAAALDAARRILPLGSIAAELTAHAKR
ncbi:chemotaxis response regulator protein-glutamate methylesterase [Paraburkholderia phenazinium]|jgi:two-component system response regulator WspF|uniref:Protein-glutamate methylesterase/protein-glutamine glutaminase n=1 Tax=Paraburkholderia phenazinium TaxID=60549 RepID=A0A1G8JJA2_9BURK|nr:chemotaxis response regulator protein-glutamate methylesterase [Paraburkholderia phenazinium]SDI31285.1 response regulator receiver modulated CheB methylesterase [Paraburkholderia phenazinium]